LIRQLTRSKPMVGLFQTVHRVELGAWRRLSRKNRRNRNRNPSSDQYLNRRYYI
jgi:hypothetical protein